MRKAYLVLLTVLFLGGMICVWNGRAEGSRQGWGHQDGPVVL